MAVSFEEARRKILQTTARLGKETVPLVEAAGRVLFQDVIAPWDMPLWDNSAMDGFAVRSEDCQQGTRLFIHGYIPAGATPDGAVAHGTAVRIMTGAPIPPGCDAIIPIENTEQNGNFITINGPVRAGDHVRNRGEDVYAEERVLIAGSLLRPAEISMLASFGYSEVPVFRRPLVAILSTGDELTEPGEKIGPGQIVNSNAYSLAASVLEAGGQPQLLGIARDEPESLREKIRQGLQADVLITSAGVSQGDRDLVCDLLEEAGVTRHFWKINIKPGRPTAYGQKDGTPVFSLPGNPVSTMVTFEELVRPALLQMQGHRQVIKPFIKAVLAEAIHKRPDRVQFLRVRVVQTGSSFLASSSGDQNTSILRTMVRANGLAVLAADRHQYAAGESIDVHLLQPAGPEDCASLSMPEEEETKDGE